MATLKRNKCNNVFFNHHPVTKALDKNTQLRHVKHYLFPGINTSSNNSISDIEDAINFYQFPPAIIEKPIPCLSTNHAPLAETPCVKDCALKLVKDKFLWKRDNKRRQNVARTAFRNWNILNKIEDNLKANKPITSLPYIIVKLAHFAAKDPDEYFDSLYNWYYGNSLATAIIGDETCLLFAGGENMSEFYFSLYDRSSSSQTIPNVSPKMKIPLVENTPIYDIVPAKDYNTVGVRQRNHCYFFVYDDTPEDINLNRCLKVEKQKYPFVSMDSFENQFCTVDAGRNVKFWTPLDAKNCYRALTLPKKNPENTDSFAQIKFSPGKEAQEFVVIDRKQLYRYDKRIGLDSPLSILNPENAVEICEEMSLLVPSLVPNYWYIGLNHTCLLYDVRAGFVQKWTHMLPQTPAFGSTCQINRKKNNPKECLLLGTQSTNNVVAIYNVWKDDVSTPNVLPVEVPVRLDTLHEAHSNAFLTDPSITKRFTRSLIGMASYKRKKRIGVFTLCSTGDIFHQCIVRQEKSSSWDSNEATRLREHELNHLKKWQDEYLNELKRKKSSLTVTRRVDFGHLAAAIVSRNPEIPPYARPDLSGPAIWKKSKETLESYRDFLAPHILHDFGIGEKSEWGTKKDEVPFPTVDPSNTDNVRDWFSQMRRLDMKDVVNIDKLFEEEDATMETDTQDFVISTFSDETNSE